MKVKAKKTHVKPALKSQPVFKSVVDYGTAKKVVFLSMN
jgi:hypothetical protein